MLPPNDIFDPARTHCPSCNATLSALTDSCAFCGFTAQICVRRYPFSPPALQRFVDPDGAIERRDQRAMDKAIRKFEKRFPQVTVSVCHMTLPENVDGREFGFWYFNTSEPRDEAERHRRLHQILIIVDKGAQSVSITVGYGLDCFIHDQFLFQTLEQTSNRFANAGYAAGIVAWLKLSSRELIPIQREAKFSSERWLRHERYRENPDDPNAREPVSGGLVDVVGAAPPVPRRPRQTSSSFTSPE